MERFHNYAIPCTSYKGGATNTINLSPIDDTYLYLYTLRLTSHTNAFHCPNQSTPCPNRQGAALIPKSVPHSGSNIKTNLLSSKGEPPLL